MLYFSKGIYMRHDYLLGANSTNPEQSSHCLYTVSIDPLGVRNQRIIEGYEWVTARFPTVLCLIGDGPLIERTAEITGIQALMVQQQARTLAERMDGSLMMSALVESDDYQEALAEVESAKRSVEEFAAAVTSDAETYVRRVQRRGELAPEYDRAMTLSEEYVLYEVAMYLCLARRGYLVDAYVGQELPVLRMFITGELSGVLSPLERRAFIALSSEVS
jgi:hypothetical protein